MLSINMKRIEVLFNFDWVKMTCTPELIPIGNGDLCQVMLGRIIDLISSCVGKQISNDYAEQVL